MDPTLFRELTGVWPVYQPAQLPHYRVHALKDRPYPGLRPAPQAMARGQLIFNLSASTMRLLDQYEGEEYELIDVTVTCNGNTVEAITYVLKKEFSSLALNRNWPLSS